MPGIEFFIRWFMAFAGSLAVRVGKFYSNYIYVCIIHRFICITCNLGKYIVIGIFYDFFFSFQDRVFWYSPGCLGTQIVDEAGLEHRSSS